MHIEVSYNFGQLGSDCLASGTDKNLIRSPRLCAVDEALDVALLIGLTRRLHIDHGLACRSLTNHLASERLLLGMSACLLNLGIRTFFRSDFRTRLD